MLNQVVLVGRLVRDPELSKSERGIERSFVTIAIPRSFKNASGEYESDFISCTLWKGIALSTVEYCKKGDIVGIKGRLQSSRYETDGVMKYKMEVIAEKVTFLSSRNKADN